MITTDRVTDTIRAVLIRRQGDILRRQNVTSLFIFQTEEKNHLKYVWFHHSIILKVSIV